MPPLSTEDRLQILYVSRQFPPAVGGAQTANFELLNQLGQRATVITEVGNCDSATGLASFYLSRYWRASRRGRACDVIFAADTALAPFAYRLGRKLGLPVVNWAHGLDVTYSSPVYQRHVVPYLRRIDQVIAVSRHTKQALVARGIGSEKIAVVGHGVTPPTEALSWTLDEARRAFAESRGEVPDRRFWLLSVGRLVKRKGIFEFVRDVFPMLQNNFSNLRLLIAGDGPEFGKIHEVIVDKKLGGAVTLLGYVSEREKKLLYRAADVFILPNRSYPENIEGFGLTVLEANAHGLPVLATAVDALTEIVVPGYNGYFVQNDAESYYRAIVAGANNSLLRQSSMAFAKEFSWETTSEKILRCLAQHARPRP